ncbi:beta-ketoacyl-[acyl-carrier-protein] synthase family protein (plasmid) [Pseudalkalibacillus hwajinpoensis]|uniref:beta-ketoacyl-[acyl-carrier-protein] synthase family protein n=1 Tax=Guptibacillus hwajinpoensis TaxID=208199 RepID=UPI00325B5782
MKTFQIAVTGIGILSALGQNKKETFENMKQNQTGIDNIQSFDASKFISNIGAEIKGYEPSDHFSPEEQTSFDRCSQYAILSIQEALGEAKLAQENIETIGLAFGTCNGGLNSLEQQNGLSNLDSQLTKNYPFFQQGDSVAKHFHFNGPVMTLNTACAASGNAIGFACDMLQHGYADAMIAGGSDSMSSSVYAGFNALKALNDKPCSPYNHRYGLSLGEGSAFLVLEPLEKALGREAKIYSVINGYGLSSDAYHETAPEPEGKGILHAVQMAVAQGGVENERIEYINTHGTGTKANDPAELKGLQSFFGDGFKDINVSSSKAYFGHNLGAAAAIEYATTLLALEHGLLPATIHFEKAREGCETAKLVTNEMRAETPDYFLCNNSAFGGHNASILSKNVFHSPQTPIFDSNSETTKQSDVVICGFGTVHALANKSGSILSSFTTHSSPKTKLEFSLKEYNKALYERRMNPLTQYSIGACDLAIKNSLQDKEWSEDIGLVYGTSRGSLKSAEKYLGSILDRGIDNASGVYFPDMVLNSTAGKIAKKFRIKGFSSSHSSGGTDGLHAMLYGTLTIKDGKQKTVLVGAGDEASDLSTEIDRALHLTESTYETTEGSTFLTLADKEIAVQQGLDVYAKVKGFGMSFNSEDNLYQTIQNSISRCLYDANLTVSDVDFIFYHNNNVSDTDEFIRLKSELGGIPISTLNDTFGYMESNGSLYHTQAAVELLALTEEEQQEITRSLGWTNGQLKTGLILTTSINGNCMAMAISK